MESSTYTDATIDLYRALHAQYPNIGDLPAGEPAPHRRLISRPSCPPLANVRLVKGAYAEPPERAFSAKADVDDAYFRHAQTLLDAAERQSGTAHGHCHARRAHDPAHCRRRRRARTAEAGSLRGADALRHPLPRPAPARQRGLQGAACSSATASTGSRGTCAASRSGPRTSGSWRAAWSRADLDRRQPPASRENRRFEPGSRRPSPCPSPARRARTQQVHPAGRCREDGRRGRTVVVSCRRAAQHEARSASHWYSRSPAPIPASAARPGNPPPRSGPGRCRSGSRPMISASGAPTHQSRARMMPATALASIE